ncbi:hypothetical protein G5714_024626 [Onychostoma macrolepis]|uniref:Uncharacterized protein n=1 Tax=Onychostoma macrolepis TaxID=369639 RepID=A0A7J6BJP1_9TELE|nr:hypothetical protein G5714_024626 [Onychostoma macrolepis]
MMNRSSPSSALILKTSQPRLGFLVHCQTDCPPAQPDSRDAPDSNIERGLQRIPRHALDINPVVRDIMMNRVFAVVSPHFEDFGSHDWVSWFTVKLIPSCPA